MKKFLVFQLVALTLLSFNSFAQSGSNEDLLNMSLDDLLDIEIVNVSKLNLQNLSEVPSAVTIVTADQIETSGAKNMEEVMRMVPGFDVIRNTQSPETSLGVRGLYSTEGTNNKILFLVNDHPIRTTIGNDASVFLGNFPVNTIKQIEVIRGPGSTLFGAGAALAVINIRTKEADNNVEAFASAGSFGTYEGTVTYTNRIKDNASVTVNGNYFTTQGPDQTIQSDLISEFLEPVARSSFFGPFAYTDSAAAGLAPGQLNYARTTSSINVKANYNDFYLLSGYINSEDEIPVGLPEALTDLADVRNNVLYGELGYRAKLMNNKAELLVKAYADNFSFTESTNVFPGASAGMLNSFISAFAAFGGTVPSNFYAPGQPLFQEQSADNFIFGTEANFAYTFGNAVTALAGVMYENNALSNVQTIANANFLIDRPMMIGSETYLGFEPFGETRDLSAEYPWIAANQRDIYAVFGQAEFNLKNIFKTLSIDHLRLVAGVRYDEYSDVGGRTNPRAALLFAPNERIYFKGLYGQAFRAPSFQELYSLNNSAFTGNPSLRPETIETFEAVLGYKIGKQLDVNVTYFDTQVNDNIQLVEDQDPNTFLTSIFTNVGNIKTSGVEGEVNYRFKDGGFVTSSLTFQNALDVTNSEFTAVNIVTGDTLRANQPDFNPGTAPDFIFNLGVNYPITKNISINVNANHLSDRQRNQERDFDFDPVEVAPGVTFPVPNGEIEIDDDRPAIPARTILNASIMLQNFNFAPNLKIQVSGYNLLDQDNFNPSRLISDSDLQRAGIHWGARISYDF